ncbi:MAG: hypothetical protein NC336_09980 [Clostridium sp.]|nr:hypothetical protein [Clostridium sp.]
MTTRLKSYILLIITATATLIATCGCAGEPRTSLLESVSVSHRGSMITVNFDQLLLETGSKLTPDSLITTPEFDSFLDFIGRDVISGIDKSSFGKIMRHADRSLVLFYASEDGQSFVTFNISDMSKLKEAMSRLSRGAMDATGGVKVYNLGSFRVGIGDNHGFIFKGEAERLPALLEETREVNASQLEGICDFLDTTGVIHLAVLSEVGEDPLGRESRWDCLRLYSEGQKGYLTFRSFLGDGSEISGEGHLKPVDTDFLRYFPADLNLVTAFGSDGEAMRCEGYFKGLATWIGSDAAEYLEMAAMSLEQTDGTAAVGIRFPAPGDTAGIAAIAMIHMPRAQLAATMALIGATAGNSEIQAGVDSRTGTLSVALPEQFARFGRKIYVAGCDGYLTTATFEPLPGCLNDFAPIFEGKNGGFYMKINSLGGLIPGCHFGIQAEFPEEEDDRGHFILRIINSDLNFMNALATALAVARENETE